MKSSFAIIVLGISIMPVLSQSLITFDLDTTTLIPGEIVELKGSVDQSLIGQPVAVEIKYSEGTKLAYFSTIHNVILIRTVTPDENGEFVLKFKVPANIKTGEIDVIANVEIEGQAFAETKSIQVKAAELEDVQDKEEPTSICGPGTVLVNGQCVPEEKESEKKGGGCLIATAAYGSELAPQVQQLRELRDNQLLQTQSGTSFMKSFNEFYYSFSPTIADWERENPVFKEVVKITLTPMISSLSILNYVDMDSEESVLGYGISLIMLNVGMYFVAPAVVIIKLRK